jgi:hypothetical protein
MDACFFVVSFFCAMFFTPPFRQLSYVIGFVNQPVTLAITVFNIRIALYLSFFINQMHNSAFGW